MDGMKRSRGYTIVEVMIVLAVSGLLFVVATIAIGDKQARSAFAQGSNDIGSRLQNLVEEVIDGQYSGIKLNKCTHSSGSGTRLLGSATEQGENSQCVFLGKLFHVKDPVPRRSYEIVALVGGRVDNGSPPQAIVNLMGANGARPTAATLLTVERTIPHQLEVKNMYAIAAAGGTFETYSFGFFQSQGAIDPLTGSFGSGSQDIHMYYVDNDNALQNSTGYNPNVQDTLHPNHLKLAKNMEICVTDGSRYAKIIVGINENYLDVIVRRLNTC